MVPKAGVEPARAQSPLDFESSASASSTTSAWTFEFNSIFFCPGLQLLRFYLWFQESYYPRNFLAQAASMINSLMSSFFSNFSIILLVR